MRHISLRSIICHTFANSTDTELLKGNKVFFLTPTGLISGIPIAPDETSSSDTTGTKTTKAIALSLLDAANGFFDQKMQEPETDRVPNDGYIVLGDVKVYSRNLSISYGLPSLVLFTSEIVGVFLGTLPEQIATSQE